MLPLARTGLTTPAVAGRGLSEGLGVTGGAQEIRNLEGRVLRDVPPSGTVQVAGKHDLEMLFPGEEVASGRVLYGEQVIVPAILKCLRERQVNGAIQLLRASWSTLEDFGHVVPVLPEAGFVSRLPDVAELMAFVVDDTNYIDEASRRLHGG